MPCEPIKIGEAEIVLCRDRPQRRRCPLCHDKWIELECDFDVGDGKTCDQKLCSRCATKIRGKGVSLDYCPKHKEAGLAALRATAAAKAK